MIWRVLVAISALAVVLTVTHANVEQAGGYFSADAPMIMAVAALTTVGMGFMSYSYGEDFKLSAVLLALLLLCGEAYWLFLTADRELLVRQAQSAPTDEAEKAYAMARKRVDEAKATKDRADLAAVEEAAKPGCKANCVALIGQTQGTANNELTAARAALAAIKMPQPGMPQWAYDLLVAALRSGVVMGASLALGMALHPRKATSREITEGSVEILPPLPMDRREHVARFLNAAIEPATKGGASLRALHAQYQGWCRSHAVPMLPAPELGDELIRVFDALGLKRKRTRDDVIIRGASLR